MTASRWCVKCGSWTATFGRLCNWCACEVFNAEPDTHLDAASPSAVSTPTVNPPGGGQPRNHETEEQ